MRSLSDRQAADAVRARIDWKYGLGLELEDPGVEEVQMMDFEAVRNLVAYGWVAAGFLFQLGLTLEQPEVRLLARLGGWEERPNHPPGKQVISRGLRRLIDQAATEAILLNHIQEHGDLPPFVKRLLAAYGYKLEH